VGVLPGGTQLEGRDVGVPARRPRRRDGDQHALALRPFRAAASVAAALCRRPLHDQRRRHHDGPRPKTGKALAQSRLQGAVDNFYASPVAGDGKIVVVSESGKAVVLKADAALTVLAVNPLDDLVYATPALRDGRLYVRTRGALYCFGRR